jgi:preprotein translocase subunit SecA
VGDYGKDEKARTINLTERGGHLMEERLRAKGLLEQGGLFDFENITVLHHVNQALKANYLFRLDVDYVVKEGKVVIVDEFTGRLMPGRRFSDGLHQALEAKEGVTIERETQTYATITFQNYFRMYKKLAGMTGTAKTEEEEFIKIYNMPVLVVPTNRAMVRTDHPDVIYKTREGKINAIVGDVAAIHQTGQPVLVGTISIEASEELSRRLQREGVRHVVLNAKYHEQEAEIVAHAGEAERVTIATNMAGRGTDIKLGEGVTELGGLFIIGTERHESRRIDNQLRGRSGRQGDPGASRFYLSLEDDLMRIFGGERIANLMTRLKVEDDEAITHVFITRAIENAQKRVEAHNFEIRKHVLEYDDVMNKQREVIYGQRREILGDHAGPLLLEMATEVLEDMLVHYLEDKPYAEWDRDGFTAQFQATFSAAPLAGWADGDPAPAAVLERLKGQIEALYRAKREDLRRMMAATHGQEPAPEQVDAVFRDFQRHVTLSILDAQWKDHLLSMDHLRQGIGLRGYGQKDPKQEYKKEGYEMFVQMTWRVKSAVVGQILRLQLVRQESAAEIEAKRMALQRRALQGITQTHAEAGGGAGDEGAPKPKQETVVRTQPKVGRNDPCPCGSGKKYKKCHGLLEG